jgi:beta-galactosidase
MRSLGLLLIPILAAAAPFDISPRREINFSTGWVFVPKDVAHAAQPDFDDFGYELVSVPHANVVTPHETFDPDTFRFVFWYRKHFSPPAEFRGKKVFVEFQGVMTVADVYLNGSRLATHKGGYTPFTVDLTGGLRYGEENILAVRVDSRVQKEVPPEGADKMRGYYLFGGIQRDVELLVVDPVHIDSVYYTTARIRPEAEVDARVAVKNEAGEQADVTVRTRLLEANGREVRSAETSARVAPGESREVRLALVPIPNAKLWDPDHPNRYVLVAEMLRGASVIDRQRTWIGIRQIDWSAADGRFSINGQPLKLRGMNRHQMFAYIGGAAPNRLQRDDARILKYEMGLNMMRCSHYPPDPQFLDECDRIGLLVMDELPAWQYIGKSREWQDNEVQAARDMILRDRNHPSIILWGVRANEASPREEDDRDLYARTYKLVEELDPTRPPCGARLSRAWHGKFVPQEVLTINDYSGGDDLAGWPQPVTGLPWFISEFGHPRQFPVWESEANLLTFTKRWLTYLDGIYKAPNVAGGTGWAAFDYNSPEFNAPHAVTAHHCVNDLLRLPKGFSAYALASQADPDRYGAMVKILTYWRRRIPEILVASNAQEVDLLVDGKTAGRTKPTLYPNVPHPLFRFSGIAFSPGELVARAYRGGAVVATDVARTPGAAVRLAVEADAPLLVADGADMSRIVVYALDDKGTVCPYEDRGIQIEVANGRFIGENPIHLEGGRIAFYVQSRYGRTQPISVRVAADGLEKGETLVNVKLPSGDQVPLSDFDLEEITRPESARHSRIVRAGLQP